MRKKIVILGSTGSIGQITFNIVKKNKKNFDVVLLTTNKNIKDILKQAKEVKTKNILISNKFHYLKAKKILKNKKIKVHNDINSLNKIIKKKIDYTMCSITGLAGLKPTLDSVKFSKRIAIANKEAIICGWNLIEKEIIKNKTQFIPIDSEHFSIWSLLINESKNNIDEIILTASGGPFLNKSNNFLNKVNPKDALNHPNWKMGKKISVDSATMMNKVFEVIEAKKIFNLDAKKFKILIHPKSYLHAIIKFKGGLIKFLAHDTNMEIPIFNSIYFNENKKIKNFNINLSKLNNLNLFKPNINNFPVLKMLNKVPKSSSLFECVLITVNDELVKYFLEMKIKYTDISKNLLKLMNLEFFKKYSSKKPVSIKQINKVAQEVRLKTKELCIK